MPHNRWVIALLLTAAVAIGCRGQEAPVTKMRVEIAPSKKVYARGETIRFRVSIQNIGPSVVYLSKSFWEAGGGFAGFYITVKQLSGKHAESGCLGAVDRGIFPDSRTPEQILREDYLRLAPGGFVGFEGDYAGCTAKYSGKYEITAQYSAQDLNQSKVRDLKVDGGTVLNGTYESDPLAFIIR